MSDSARLEAAATEAKAARDRLYGTMHELQARLDPPRLLDEAVSGIKSGAMDLAESAGAAARRRPGMVTGIAAGAALLLFRRPLGRLLRGKRKPPAETERDWYR